MPIRNSDMSADHVLTILDIARLILPGPWGWVGEDLDEEPAIGAILRAVNPATKEDNLGSITIADVSRDPTEPDIGSMPSGELPAIDKYLSDEIRAGLASEGIEVTKWLPSHLIESGGIKKLESEYFAIAAGIEWRYVAQRMKALDRKLVVIGCMNVTKDPDFAVAVLHTMRKIQFRSDANWKIVHH
jgi:hypothetical protein